MLHSAMQCYTVLCSEVQCANIDCPVVCCRSETFRKASEHGNIRGLVVLACAVFLRSRDPVGICRCQVGFDVPSANCVPGRLVR